jgi:GDP-L-fucose synthase
VKIVITGGTGMVGRNLLECDELNSHALSAPAREVMDLSDKSSILRYLGRENPDLVIHCAGHVGGIQSNMIHKADYLYLNLQMGLNLVAACHETGVTRVLNMGSSCMYPRNIPYVIPEERIMTGELEPTNEGYAIAKIATAKLCEYISNEHPNRFYKTLIPCNLYGRWDKFDPSHSHLIPAVIRKLHQAKETAKPEIDIWGTGEARREFMYAGDLARIVASLIKRFEQIPAYLNVGLGYDHSINEYYRIIADVVGYRGTFFHDLDRPVGMSRKLVDITKLMALGIQVDSGLKNGVEKAYEFFKSHQL